MGVDRKNPKSRLGWRLFELLGKVGRRSRKTTISIHGRILVQSLGGRKPLGGQEDMILAQLALDTIARHPVDRPVSSTRPTRWFRSFHDGRSNVADRSA